jgi:hypothetical protein
VTSPNRLLLTTRSVSGGFSDSSVR